MVKALHTRTLSSQENLRVNLAVFSTYMMSVSCISCLLPLMHLRDLREPVGKCAPPPTVERLFHFLFTKPMPTT